MKLKIYMNDCQNLIFQQNGTTYMYSVVFWYCYANLFDINYLPDSYVFNHFFLFSGSGPTRSPTTRLTIAFASSFSCSLARTHAPTLSSTACSAPSSKAASSPQGRGSSQTRIWRRGGEVGWVTNLLRCGTGRATWRCTGQTQSSFFIIWTQKYIKSQNVLLRSYRRLAGALGGQAAYDKRTEKLA